MNVPHPNQNGTTPAGAAPVARSDDANRTPATTIEELVHSIAHVPAMQEDSNELSSLSQVDSALSAWHVDDSSALAL